jgi:tRNA dimethylallyltransferase
MKQTRPTIYAIVGPTASGKSDFAVVLAKKINGEIISVDSRQVYKGMDLGTGKVETKTKIVNGKKVLIYKNIPHYGLNLVNPNTDYNVAKFKSYAEKHIKDILSRGKVPILCGGTAHWIDAVVFNQTIPEVKPNPKIRNELSRLSTKEMYSKLVSLDPERAQSIDPHNPRRLIRALEIVLSTGSPVPKQVTTSPYNCVWIGIKPDDAILKKNIELRLDKRLKEGLVEEIKRLHKNGVSFKRLVGFGLEYKYGSLYLQNKLSLEEFKTQLNTAIWHYSKRQMTWWKRNKQIVWIKDAKDYKF